MLDIFVFNFKEIMCTFLNKKEKNTRNINCLSAGIKTSECLLNAYHVSVTIFILQIPLKTFASQLLNLHFAASTKQDISQDQGAVTLIQKVSTDSSCAWWCFGLEMELDSEADLMPSLCVSSGAKLLSTWTALPNALRGQKRNIILW